MLINVFWRKEEGTGERKGGGGIIQVSLSFELRAQQDEFSNISEFTTSTIVPGTQKHSIKAD